ncbi:hypothetical protein GV794_24270 [Nocardia cyriacigeorgica]|uniref:Secreted protein n=1 Tax=Nocardia cyriacigeorgica TaxID=135487 RepID=A0A6P1DAJ5_9NOCA|nr:hypothetical protein [Nocardia cyriacigeorgica]NEW39692.1 hypothetical protein [Nocardia cyriacigeorgica]NEW46254.1 hypothetical protein [Nocardia cyriacigeorgica]NEW50182.1 hypothetical protein [Nocardia cyriacigeorgica]NEW58730.1 hypothetical protein [Nocardia cyriacigeorgica]
MSKNTFRATVAAAAIAPMIALGSGIGTAAPVEAPSPVQVEPAVLSSTIPPFLWPLIPFCFTPFPHPGSFICWA